MKHNTSIPSSHWIFAYHVKKKNHLQNEAKVPLSIRPSALVRNASNLHSNIVWKTHFSKLLSLEFTFVNSNYTKKKKKKKKYVKNRKWWRSWDKLNVAFLHWRCCLQKFLERRCDLRLVHVRQTLQLARSLCWKTSLSLSYTANCSQPCTKEWPPLFLTTSRIPFSSMLFTLHEFTRFLTSPLFRWEINPSIVGIVLSTVREQKLWTD